METKSSTFGFPWHDSLMPIGPNYTALGRAVFECACAGCESIWITVNDDWAPLIKDQIGDYVYDPVWYYRQYDVNPSDNRKIIPIFFVPHQPKYRDRRDSLGWGIINAAIYAKKVAGGLSKFTTPNRFYAAFPFGVYDPRALISSRVAISSENSFCLSYNNNTIKDNCRLGFSFTWEDVKKINLHVFKEGTGERKATGAFIKGDPRAWSKRLPAEKQYSARFFSLEKVFEPLNVENAKKLELMWYYDINNWGGYKSFMGSEHILKRPTPLVAGKLPLIGVDND